MYVTVKLTWLIFTLGVGLIVLCAWKLPWTVCEVRVHEFKWEALLEVRLVPEAWYPGQCALACFRLGVRRG